MKTEISRDSHQPEKRYSGIYQQQGRMLTDADWNELVEILKERLNDALKDIVGCREGTVGGTPHHRALKINNDRTIKPGHVYIDGLVAFVPGEDNIAVNKQNDFPNAPDLVSNCVIYADVWERTVTSLMDNSLRDMGLHGADTCTRKEVMVQIKWCPAGTDPESLSDTPHKGSARATITLLKKSDDPDICDPCVEQHEVESRIGNYLFRVEVHSVKGAIGDPDEITLKWSMENGAIQSSCTLEDIDGNDITPPTHFTTGKWLYDFFDETSEKHLGVHHNESATWSPTRGQLVKENYAKPTTSPNDYVRRWDGYCKLVKGSTGWDVNEQYDKNQGATGFVSVAGEQLTITLDAQEILIDLAPEPSSIVIVAGDYWLAEVRESVHSDQEEVITNALPQGIKHHYLKLGEVGNGLALMDNPERERKYEFPALTEMTRMFIVGGEGQEAMPDHKLLNPIQVGVANGEWPVTGAKVRFTLNPGNGELSRALPFSAETVLPIEIESENGLAQCFWKLGDGVNPHLRNQRVKAELLGPDGSTPLSHPPLFFNANLSTADQVAYDNPSCGSGSNPTVQSLFRDDTAVQWPDYDEDGDVTVKDVLTAFLCKLRASHIPFYPETCDGEDLTPTVKTGLGISSNTNVHAVLQKLICKLDASKVPYDPNASPSTTSRWKDIKETQGVDGDLSAPNTVQSAIDDMIVWLESTDITYSVPSCNSVALPTPRTLLPGILGKATGALIKIDNVLDELLCEFKATHLPVDRSSLCTKLADRTGSAKVETVQDAINALCLDDQSGGCCTITISPGDDLGARLTDEIAKNADAHVCIMAGEYIVKEPVILEERGNITIEGCGDGTVIRSPNSESAIILNNCKSVVVRDLTMQSNKLGKKESSGTNHLNGVLTISNVDDVTVEAVSLKCAHGGLKMASCLTVAPNSKVSSVRIKSCRLSPGHQQIGILLVNANRARIEDNEVKVRPQRRNSSLKKRLKDKGYRLTIRKMMLSDVVVVDSKTPTNTKRNIEFGYEGRLLRFKTPASLERAWRTTLGNLKMKSDLRDRDLVRYIKDVADSNLLALASGKKDDAASYITGFKNWFDVMKAHLPAIASRGIVVAGQYANDICITKNSICGVAQGIHIGMSHSSTEKEEPDFAGRLLVDGNHVVNYLSPQELGEWHGIFVGNFECLLVENNHLELKKYPYDLGASMNGVRVVGYFGSMLQVRGNRLNGYATGIFAKALNTSYKETCLWQVENNLLGGASGGPVLSPPPPKFIVSNNLY